MGWKDTLAHSAISARQRDYAASRGDRQVYTPQAVVNGRRQARHRGRCGPRSGAERRGLVRAGNRAGEVSIARGDNRGRSVTYANVVRGLFRVGAWAGAARFELPLDQTRSGGSDGYVVLLQASEPGVLPSSWAPRRPQRLGAEMEVERKG